MALTDAQRRANEKYQREKCDRFIVTVPKGEHAVLKQHATELDMSLSRLIRVAIEEYAQNHKVE